jgi:ABC-type Fe3+-hydroxamate transport system substrate-binding protein
MLTPETSGTPRPSAPSTPSTPPRVVSLLPSATEALCAVGGEHLLVGRSHECDFPASIRYLPILTAQRIPHTAAPAEIDSMVSAALAQSQSLYTIDEPLLRELRPDVILTQDLCDVCSINLETVQRLAASLPNSPRVVSLNPTTVEGTLDDLLTVALATGLQDRAMPAIVALRERLYRTSDFVNPFDDGPVLAFLEWTDPLFCAGHWTPQLIERAGARHPLNPTVPKPTAGAAAGPQMAERVAGKSIRIPEDALVAIRPEFLVICPCGLDLDRTRECARALTAKTWWRDLPAVRNGRVALVDGNQMFNRPGPRLVDAYEWLVGWLQDRPDLIPPGFPWERFA